MRPKKTSQERNQEIKGRRNKKDVACHTGQGQPKAGSLFFMSLLVAVYILALVQSSILTRIVGAGASSTMAVDHIGDPASNAFTTVASSLRPSSARFREAIATHGRRIDVQPRNGTIGTELAIGPANVKRGDRGATAHQRAALGIGDGRRHGGCSVAEQNVHVFEANTTGFGVQEEDWKRGKSVSIGKHQRTPFKM